MYPQRVTHNDKAVARRQSRDIYLTDVFLKFTRVDQSSVREGCITFSTTDFSTEIDITDKMPGCRKANLPWQLSEYPGGARVDS